jgi:hypothetical protein
MSTVTLEQIEAQHTQLAKMIEAFKAALPNTLSIPMAQIELAQGERYAGLILGADGKPTHHLVLLPGDAEELEWQQAVEWAEKQGGTLPTRAEQSLLFANLKGEFQGAYYWSGQQHETNSGWAWCQHFGYGHQYDDGKDLEFRFRAVRRLVIE